MRKLEPVLNKIHITKIHSINTQFNNLNKFIKFIKISIKNNNQKQTTKLFSMIIQFISINNLKIVWLNKLLKEFINRLSLLMVKLFYNTLISKNQIILIINIKIIHNLIDTQKQLQQMMEQRHLQELQWRLNLVNTVLYHKDHLFMMKSAFNNTQNHSTQFTIKKIKVKMTDFLNLNQ